MPSQHDYYIGIVTFFTVGNTKSIKQNNIFPVTAQPGILRISG